MIQFIVKRLAYGVLVVFLVCIIISSVIYLAPVDPARLTFGQRSDTEAVKAKQKELGLDQALYVQLAFYLRDISPIALLADTQENREKYRYFRLVPLGQKALVLKAPYLRYSFQTGASVAQILGNAIPKTAILALAAILLATIVGISLGILAALKHNSWFDHSAVIGSVMGFSLPSYVSAMILALLFGYYWSDFTGLNVRGSIYDLNDFGDEQFFWKNLILPALALGIRPIAIITQLTRSAMLDVLEQDYIRTAKAKGLTYYKVIFKHALRNAMNPVITAISGWFAALLAGAFFVENVFDFNGLGQVTVNALLTYDIPVVLGAVLFTAVLFVGINIVVDVLYAIFDPRVSVKS
ncbi:MAG: ABC transporter permease [Bacteroidota bacterium]